MDGLIIICIIIAVVLVSGVILLFSIEDERRARLQSNFDWPCHNLKLALINSEYEWFQPKYKHVLEQQFEVKNCAAEVGSP